MENAPLMVIRARRRYRPTRRCRSRPPSANPARQLVGAAAAGEARVPVGGEERDRQRRHAQRGDAAEQPEGARFAAEPVVIAGGGRMRDVAGAGRQRVGVGPDEHGAEAEREADTDDGHDRRHASIALRLGAARQLDGGEGGRRDRRRGRAFDRRGRGSRRRRRRARRLRAPGRVVNRRHVVVVAVLGGRGARRRVAARHLDRRRQRQLATLAGAELEPLARAATVLELDDERVLARRDVQIVIDERRRRRRVSVDDEHARRRAVRSYRAERARAPRQQTGRQPHRRDVVRVALERALRQRRGARRIAGGVPVANGAAQGRCRRRRLVGELEQRGRARELRVQLRVLAALEGARGRAHVGVLSLRMSRQRRDCQRKDQAIEWRWASAHLVKILSFSTIEPRAVALSHRSL